MDLYRTIRDLLEERKRLDALIARLERSRDSAGSGAPERAGRRGRKGMTEEQRQEVSERMRKYWEKKRQAVANAAAPRD